VRCAANVCELNSLWADGLYIVAVRSVFFFFFLSGPVFFCFIFQRPRLHQVRSEQSLRILLSSRVYNAPEHIFIPYYGRLTAKFTLRYYAFALVVLRRQDYHIIVRPNCGRYYIIIVTTGKKTFAFQCLTHYTRHYYNYYYRA